MVGVSNLMHVHNLNKLTKTTIPLMICNQVSFCRRNVGILHCIGSSRPTRTHANGRESMRVGKGAWKHLNDDDGRIKEKPEGFSLGFFKSSLLTHTPRSHCKNYPSIDSSKSKWVSLLNDLMRSARALRLRSTRRSGPNFSTVNEAKALPTITPLRRLPNVTSSVLAT
jgi:hypothetical protein